MTSPQSTEFDLIGHFKSIRSKHAKHAIIHRLDKRIAIYERLLDWPALAGSLKADLATMLSIYKQEHGPHELDPR